jgi:hypothetical protein
MKTTILSHGRILGLLAVILVFAVSCEDTFVRDTNQIPAIKTKTSVAYVAPDYCGEPHVSTLFAGQHMDAGTLTVGNDSEFVYVTYTTSGDWMLQEVHLYVGSLGEMPLNKSGNPQIGRFPIKETFSELTTSFSATLPIAMLDDCFAVAAHAVVVKVVGGEVVAEETAWADGDRISGGSWAMYFNYCVAECEVVDTDCTSETAWAVGLRYVQPGNWATYTPYEGYFKQVTLFAGQNINIGWVTFSAPVNGMVTISIDLVANAGFQNVAENVKIQDYEFAPMGNPSIGLFEYKGTASGQSFSIEVPFNNFYGVHVDALVCPVLESPVIVMPPVGEQLIIFERERF